MQYGNNPIEIGCLQPTAYSLLLDRGYTSHEHLFEVGLIHMNGRLYDPLLRRFLNADEHIQDPYNTQNYNKYGYVYNNPLMYNDPSGELIPIVAVIAIGAAVGLASYTIALGVTGNIHNWNLFDAFKATFFGAIGGAVTFGVGEIFNVASQAGRLTQIGTLIQKSVGDFGLAIVQAGTHAVAQGVLSVFQGEGFRQAFWSGALGSLGASGFQAVAGKFAKSTIGTIAFGALSGGIGAELSDGNFWEGAVIGGIVAGLNHSLHKMNNEYTIDRELKKAGIDPNKIPKMGDLNQVKKMLEKVPSLKNLNNLSGNTTDFKFSPSLEDYAVTPNSGKGNVVYLGKLAFSTNRTLAIMVGHELMHVYHNYSGLRAQWNKSYGSMNGKYISEFLAHSWSNSMLNMTNAYSSSDLKNYFYNKIKHLKF